MTASSSGGPKANSTHLTPMFCAAKRFLEQPLRLHDERDGGLLIADPDLLQGVGACAAQGGKGQCGSAGEGKLSAIHGILVVAAG